MILSGNDLTELSYQATWFREMITMINTYLDHTRGYHIFRQLDTWHARRPSIHTQGADFTHPSIARVLEWTLQQPTKEGHVWQGYGTMRFNKDDESDIIPF